MRSNELRSNELLRQGGSIYRCDCMTLLRSLADGEIDLVYVDPPFNTGKRQESRQVRCKQLSASSSASQATVSSTVGGLAKLFYRGFGGRLYAREEVSRIGYEDKHEDYISWLREIMLETRRVLSAHGSLFLHLDWRESHYAKVMLDEVFGRDCFQNEIIWVYDFGGRSKSKWSAKHDTILWYSKDSNNYCFNYDAIDRIPYLAPGLVGPEKAKRGKTPTDVWWQTIVATQGSERMGYPNQKPLAIVERIIRVHSSPNDLVLDFFAGSGTTGEAARNLDRNFVLGDISAAAIKVMRRRFAGFENIRFSSLKKTATTSSGTSSGASSG